MPIRDLLLALTVVLLWGVNFVVMKHAVSEVPPFLLTALRFGLAAVPAVFLVRRPAVFTWHLIAYGAGFGIVQFGFMFTAFRLGIPAGLTAIVLQTQAFFTIALAFWVLGERPSRLQNAGICVAAAGVAVVFAGAAQGAALLPVALVIAAGLGWAGANIALKLARPDDIFGFTVWGSLVPPLPMLALSAATEGFDAWSTSWAHLTWLGVAAVLYLAYPISLATGMAWNSLLSRYPAATFAPFALLVPVIGMAAGAVVYGERITITELAGSILVLAGLVIIMVAARSAARPTAIGRNDASKRSRNLQDSQ